MLILWIVLGIAAAIFLLYVIYKTGLGTLIIAILDEIGRSGGGGGGSSGGGSSGGGGSYGGGGSFGGGGGGSSW